jgi:hypothetical protein
VDGSVGVDVVDSVWLDVDVSLSLAPLRLISLAPLVFLVLLPRCHREIGRHGVIAQIAIVLPRTPSRKHPASFVAARSRRASLPATSSQSGARALDSDLIDGAQKFRAWGELLALRIDKRGD